MTALFCVLGVATTIQFHAPKNEQYQRAKFNVCLSINELQTMKIDTDKLMDLVNFVCNLGISN
jgi:hypothetical protein